MATLTGTQRATSTFVHLRPLPTASFSSLLTQGCKVTSTWQVRVKNHRAILCQRGYMPRIKERLSKTSNACIWTARQPPGLWEIISVMHFSCMLVVLLVSQLLILYIGYFSVLLIFSIQDCNSSAFKYKVNSKMEQKVHTRRHLEPIQIASGFTGLPVSPFFFFSHVASLELSTLK